MRDLELKQQMPVNLAMNIVSFVLNMGIGLWLVPYLVSNLGKAAYGLVPLAMVFTEYVGIITQALNVAINRFLLIALQKGDADGAGEIFNSSLVAVGAFALVQIPVMAFIVADLPDLVTVPESFESDAMWLFGLTFASFLLVLVRAVFAVSMFAQNRIDLQRINDIVRIVVRVGVILALFGFDRPTLAHVGTANLVSSIALFLVTLRYWRQLTPELAVRPSQFRMESIRELTSMGGWVLVGQIGYLLFVRLDIFLINRFISAEAGGEYAALMQWSTLIRNVSGVFGGIVAPVAMIYHARGETQKLVEMTQLAVKLLSVSVAIPTALLAACSGELLTLWLGEDFGKLGWLLALQLAPLWLSAASLPLFPINAAYNKVRLPGVVTLALGCLNLVLAYGAIRFTNLGYYGVAASVGLVLVVKNGAFTPIYVARIIGTRPLLFLWSTLSGGAVFVGVAVVGLAVRQVVPLDSYAGLVGYFLVTGLLSWPVGLLVFSRGERSKALRFVPSRARRVAARVMFVDPATAGVEP